MTENIEKEFCNLCGQVINEDEKHPDLDNGHLRCIKHFLTYLTPPTEEDRQEQQARGQPEQYFPLMAHTVRTFISNNAGGGIELSGVTKLGIQMEANIPIHIDIRMMIRSISWSHETLQDQDELRIRTL